MSPPHPQPTGQANSRGQLAWSGAGQTGCLWDPGHEHRLGPTRLWRCQSSALLPSSFSIHTPPLHPPTSSPQLPSLLHPPYPSISCYPVLGQPLASPFLLLHSPQLPHPQTFTSPSTSATLPPPTPVSCTSSSYCLTPSVPFPPPPSRSILLYSCSLLPSSIHLFYLLLHPLSPPSCFPLGQAWKLRLLTGTRHLWLQPTPSLEPGGDCKSWLLFSTGGSASLLPGRMESPTQGPLSPKNLQEMRQCFHPSDLLLLEPCPLDGNAPRDRAEEMEQGRRGSEQVRDTGASE